MKYVFYSIVFLATLLVSCSKQAGLSGTIKMNDDELWASQVYLIDPLTFIGIASSFLGRVIDSATIGANGRFVFDEMPQALEPTLLQVAIQQKGERYCNKLEMDNLEVSNYFPIVWKSEEHIKISTTAEYFQKDFSIKNPSLQNKAMLQLRDLRLLAFQKYLDQLDSDIHDDNYLLKKAKALQNFQKPLMAFAEESPHLLPALTATRWLNLEGNYERTPEFIFGLCEKWKSIAADHHLVTQLCNIGSRDVLPVLKGDSIPDFPLPMLTGDTMSLNSLWTGKKLILLDLWASWCMPCRLENRTYLVPLWESHHQDGFQIIGYALDATQSVWSKAIEKDGAERWLNASHLRGDDAPLFKALRIATIPANFLVDDQGKVVAKNLHGEELVKFVDEFMNNY